MKKTRDEILAETLKVLREGGLILYPTDTVWGIGCDATNPEAVAKVYALKQRSDAKALVLLASGLDQVGRYVREIPDIAIQLVEVNDRPMTLIYPGAMAGKAPAEGEKAVIDKHFLAWNVVAEDGSVGIRIPMMEFGPSFPLPRTCPAHLRRPSMPRLCRRSAKALIILSSLGLRRNRRGMLPRS